MSDLSIVLVFPGLLGTSGDRGNALVLRHRAAARGLEVELVEVEPGQPVPDSADVYVIGGGEDEAQGAACELLARDGGLPRAVGRGAPVLAVCAGFQLLGESFPVSGDPHRAGLGLVDVRTERVTQKRAVGELLLEPTLPGLPPLTGYENHAGRTVLGADATPLGRVVAGIGNGVLDGAVHEVEGGSLTDGVLAGSVVGTYLHGPVLARNPALADLLLERATGGPLAPLDDAEVEQLRRERLAAVRAQTPRP
ncbi:MAG: type 1 glutamine amidotransferase [Motilibacteraceae bacterium]